MQISFLVSVCGCIEGMFRRHQNFPVSAKDGKNENLPLLVKIVLIMITIIIIFSIFVKNI